MLTLAAASPFGLLDWVVVGAYLALLLVSGWLLARREPSRSDEYFLAGRRMPAWAVAFSIIASTLSVATFLGAPEQSYKGDLTYLSTNIGGLIAVAVVAVFFIPAFYRHNCTTIYELLERRFGPGAKLAASGAFMIGRVFASGARVYIASIPLAMLFFGDGAGDNAWALIACIFALSLVAVLYTLIGGIASVIWTDVIQVIVLIGSVIAAVVLLLNRLPMPAADMVTALEQGGPGGASKLTVLKLGFDFSKPGLGFDPSATFTLLTAVFGFSLLNMAAYGADHDMVQRMLTCKSAVKGSKSVVGAILMGIPIVGLFLLVGLLLHLYYQRTDYSPMAQPISGERAFTFFILHELPVGLRGVMIAGLFAVGLGSLNSAINAMAATAVSDFYRPLREQRLAGARRTETVEALIAPAPSDRHYLIASRWATIAWGLILAVFAAACIFWKRSSPDTGLIDFALGVMNFAYSGLLAVFLCALFTRRGNTTSAIAALITGFVVVLLLQPWMWSRWAVHVPWGAIGTLADVKIAYPWHMLIACSLALTVCIIPPGRRASV